MKCIPDGTLRAKLDGELADAELREVNNHLASCSGCQRRAETIRHQSERVTVSLSALSTPPGVPPADPGIAFARFRAQQASGRQEAAPVMSSLFAGRLRPVWGAVALAALVTTFLSLAPARSWAQKVLAMLRVQRIAVVSINPNLALGPNGGDRVEKMISQMLSDNVVVTMPPGEPQVAANAAQASRMAGFRVRLLTSRPEFPQLRVHGEQAFHMTVDRSRLQGILEEVGRSDLELPASLDGATIAVHIPKLVMAGYGCPEFERHNKANSPGDGDPQAKQRARIAESTCVMLIQSPSPTVSVPPDLNIAQIAEAGLQLAGWSAQDAHAFCQSVDWTSTLVLPLPRSVTSHQTVEVDGVQGTLIDIPPEGRRLQPGYGLLWVKNGVIYSLMGNGNSADAVTLAASLK